MVAMNDILSNDRPLVQILGYIVGRRANDLDATLECLLIRTRTYKRREKAVMDINDLVRIGFDKERLQYLHITGENEEIYPAIEEFEHTHLIVQATVFADRKVEVRNLVALRHRFQVWMVTENTGDIERQFAAIPTPEQIREAMVKF